MFNRGLTPAPHDTIPPSARRHHRGFLLAIIYIVSLVGGMTGCQIIDQLYEIPSVIAPPAPPPRHEMPLWQDTSEPAGPKVSGHAGALLGLKAVGSPPRGLYSVGTDKKVLYWDLESGKATVVRTLNTTMNLSLATFGARHALLAYSDGADVVVECVHECPRNWTLKKLRARAKTLDFHTDDSAVLLGSVDGKVSRWKFVKEVAADTLQERDKTFEVYAGHQTVVSAVVAHPYNRAFFSGDWSGSLYAWLPYDSDDYGGKYDRNLFTSHFYAAPGTFTKGLREVDRGVISIAMSEDGNRLALGSENGFLETWSVRGFERESRLEIHRGRILSVALSPRGDRVATIGRDGFVRIFEVVDDPEFGISATALRKKLLPVESYEVPDGVMIKYISDRSVVIGTSAGKLLEADAAGLAVAPTPAPTPRQDPDRSVDTDY